MKKQPKNKRRMRCPNCNSLSVKKNGRRENLSVGNDRKTTRKIQRYKCKNCSKSFCKRRDKHKHYSTGFKIDIVRQHIEERKSFRVIEKRFFEKYGIKIKASYLCYLFNETIKNVKSSKQIQVECQPEWEGYLIVDDKRINVKGEKKVSLIAKDRSGDIVHEELLPYAEQDAYDNFFIFIKERLNYRFKAVTTDLDRMLEKSIKTVLGADIPHQKCLKHSLDNLYRIVKSQPLKTKERKLLENVELASGEITSEKYQELLKIRGKIEEIEELLELVKKYLWQADKKKSAQLEKKIQQKYNKDYPEIIDFLTRNKKGLFAFQKDKNIPKTNNDAENVNRQLKRRLKTIEAFQTEENAYNYLITICNYLRTKPYTDCKKHRKYRNGSSPLQLCNTKINVSDWVRFSLNL